MSETQPTQQQERSSRGVMGAILIVCCLIVLGSLMAFRPALDGAFLNWDDDRNFVFNMEYRGLESDNLSWAWRTYHMGVWQPAAWTLLGAEHVIAGTDESGAPNPGVYHAFSIALHTANGLLLFALLVVLLRVSRRDVSAAENVALVIASGAAALLFVVHPLRTEVVTWISAQPYLPAVFFAMLGALVYVMGHSVRAEGKTHWPALAIALVCYVVAVLFKAVAITLPALLLIADVYPLRRITNVRGIQWERVPRILMEKLPFVPVAIVVAWFAAESKAVTNPGADVSGLPFLERVVQTCYGFVFYLAKTIVPTDLGPFYELPQSLSLGDPRFGGAVALVVGGIVALFFLRNRLPGVVACLLAYAVIVLPNSGIVQISQQLVADRYGYFSLMPIAALIAYGLWLLMSRGAGELRKMRWIGISLAVVVASLSLIRTSRAYTRDWCDSESLWRRAVRLDPESPNAHCHLGVALLADGDYSEAKEYLLRAIDLREDFVFAYSNLGVACIQLREYREAIACYEKAMLARQYLFKEDQVRMQMGLAAARYELGVELKAKRDWAGVIECYEKLLPLVDRLPERLRPEVYFDLAIARFETGDEKGAWRDLREAQRLGIPSERVEDVIKRY